MRKCTFKRCPICQLDLTGLEIKVWPLHCVCGTVLTADGDVLAAGYVGPGTHLHQMLKRLGIRETRDCGCRDKSRLMDARGPEWCEQHVEEIVDWMLAEAAKRGPCGTWVPRWIARFLVRRAIAQSRSR